MKDTNLKKGNANQKRKERKEKKHEFVVCINVVKTLFEWE